MPTTTIAQKLDLLAAAFEAKDMAVGGGLKPGLSKDELARRTSWFPARLPDELVEMYQWRNGQHVNRVPWFSPYKDNEFEELTYWDEPDASIEEDSFCFRDQDFLSVEMAREVYLELMEYYDPESAEIDLTQCFPFAAFQACYSVLSCGPDPVYPPHERPVIEVYHSVDVVYFSVESMLETCLAWVCHPVYTRGAYFPREIEAEIWNRHNPGLF